MFPVVEVQNEIEIIEYLGTKEKFWFKSGNALHLLKVGREGTGENWSEKIACELCTLLGIPHAHYDLATHMGRQAVVTPNMIEEESRLVLGNELIDSTDKPADGARFYKYRGHTVSRVVAVLSLYPDNPEEAIKAFVGYLMLDAWIGNGDRHSENWGIVVNPEKSTILLAPTFDHASCLGRELSDEARARRLTTSDKRQSVLAYSDKARSGLYGDKSDTRPLSPIDAFHLAGSAGKGHMDFWLNALSNIREEDVANLFDMVPSDFLSSEAASFGIALLNINKQKLLG